LFNGLEVVHKERKNLGMTYVYVIKNSPADPDLIELKE
jgi:hypothetical protein